jgi:hypothetical protein
MAVEPQCDWKELRNLKLTQTWGIECATFRLVTYPGKSLAVEQNYSIGHDERCAKFLFKRSV